MSRAEVTHFRWLSCKRVFGADHPATRAAFGRYVGAMRGTISVRAAGLEAVVACQREKGWDGYHNKAARSFLGLTDLPTGGTLSQHNL